MARAVRRKPARKGRARKPNRRQRRNKKASLMPTNQYATIVETLASANVFSDKPYSAQFQLSQFFRATALAKNFMYYRAKTVKWEYMPLYNTFQEGPGTNTTGKPQFYMMMNRGQIAKFNSILNPAQALFSIQSAGADPTPFTKNKEIIYRPNWNSPGLSSIQADPDGIVSIATLGLKHQYGWLPTANDDVYFNPDSVNFLNNTVGSAYDTVATFNGGVVYNGHNFYIQQSNEPYNKVATVVCTVEWEFKGGKQLYGNPPTDTSVHEDLSGSV